MTDQMKRAARGMTMSVFCLAGLAGLTACHHDHDDRRDDTRVIERRDVEYHDNDHRGDERHDYDRR